MRLLNVQAFYDFVQAEGARVETFQKEKEAASNAAIKSDTAVES